MNTRPKTKMCWNCEGNVILTENTCPYCRVTLEQSLEEKKKHDPYTPPYNISNYISNASIPTSPFALMQHEEQSQIQTSIETTKEENCFNYCTCECASKGNPKGANTHKLCSNRKKKK